MKNFKKVLALVLVLATLMGFATVAGAAYKDAADISGDYTEAVKVLELIETMEGYPDGTFGPKKTITREEAAKLIAIFDNKDSDISTYYTSINPFADEKGRWGESYVGYGYRAGIIAGMNATTYAPTANVTGTQFLKMALVTLGYDQEAEGFVGSSWAVNVLALARKLDLIDGLADGWKAEKDLTREEAAQILLNTLKADTVEYAQEAKQVGFKPTATIKGNTEISYVWNGRIYLTVAGAVSTGKPLYKEFKLKTVSAEDAFYRPYTKWVLDNDYDDSIEVMKAPKATFTTTFNTCELLVALGVKESDTKTEIKIEEYYVNGIPQDYQNKVLHHTASKCHLKDSTQDAYHTFGAQGTLTQVFKMKDAAGDTVYRICSIDTWLAKVEKVDKTTTSRDNHKKGVDNVLLTVSKRADSQGDYNNKNYCYTERHGCDKAFVTVTSDGKQYVAYDDPKGLAKNDYVLMTYSWRTESYVDEDKKTTTFEAGVQSVDVTEAKEGRLNGFKALHVTNDPSETRIDGEFVKDAVHFHLGYMDSKNEKKFGTHAFFYDAYGNVIGMKDAADTSTHGVIDKAWVELDKGVATLHANLVGLDAKLIEDVIVTDFTGWTAPDAYKAQFNGKFDITLADFVNLVWSDVYTGQNFKEFYGVYDLLGEFTVNSDNEYKLGRDDHYENNTNAGITIVSGKPYVTVGTGSAAKTYKTNADTQYLVRTGDVGEGKYEAYTGYDNVKSMKATGYDILMDDDDKFAEIVYVYNSVVYTDGTVVAYVPGDAYLWKEEEGSTTYYRLKVYIDGVEDTLRITKAEAEALGITNNFYGRGNVGTFAKFQYVDIKDVTTAKLVGTTGFKLATEYEVKSYGDGVLEIKNGTTFGDTNESIMALAPDCVVYAITDDGKIVKESVEYAEGILEAGRKVHVEWNDNNDKGENKISVLYVVENPDEA